MVPTLQDQGSPFLEGFTPKEKEVVALLNSARALVRLVAAALWIASFGVSVAYSSQASGGATRYRDGAGTKGSVDPKSASPAPDGGDATIYRIGVADELQISVWKEPELSETVVVRPDGKITLPLVNEVPVVGLRTTELQDVLTAKLKPLVNEPQVTVVVRAIKSRKVYLVGKAQRPGTFPLNDRITVLELLAEAGGLSPFAKSGSIYILRNEQGKQSRIPFNYKKALSGKADDPVLQPGDMVVVP